MLRAMSHVAGWWMSNRSRMWRMAYEGRLPGSRRREETAGQHFMPLDCAQIHKGVHGSRSDMHRWTRRIWLHLHNCSRTRRKRRGGRKGRERERGRRRKARGGRIFPEHRNCPPPKQILLRVLVGVHCGSDYGTGHAGHLDFNML